MIEILESLVIMTESWIMYIDTISGSKQCLHGIMISCMTQAIYSFSNKNNILLGLSYMTKVWCVQSLTHSQVRPGFYVSAVEVC